MCDTHNFVEVEWLGTQDELEELNKAIWVDVYELMLSKASDPQKPEQSAGSAKVEHISERHYVPKYYERIMGPNGWIYKYKDKESGVTKVKKRLSVGDAVKTSSGHLVVKDIKDGGMAKVEHHLMHPTSGKHIGTKKHTVHIDKVSSIGLGNKKRASGLKSKYL